MTAPAFVIGKYRIITTLGQGGMGDVHLAALDGPAGFAKLVVVKAMRSFIATDARFKSMLLDEARLAARLNHPNIVQTIEVGDIESQPFIAMEYLAGQPLSVILDALRNRGDSLRQSLAAYIICEVLAGLQYAHDLEDFDGRPLQIVHRDVTPHNIFVTYEGEVKILDFGVAKAATNSVETETGIVKGKIKYMAPEQAAGEAIDRRADVFAVGLVLWELLTGKRLMEGESALEVLERLLRKPMPSIIDYCPNLDQTLGDVVERALRRPRDERFKTAQQMREALLPFARDVRREDLAQRISSMFESERQKIRETIRTAMRAADISVPSSRNFVSPISAPLSDTGVTGAVATRDTGLGDTEPMPAARGRKWLRWAAPIVAGAAGFMAWYGWTHFATARSQLPTTAAASPPSPPPIPVEVTLRLQGSDTIGKELAPALAEAFFRQRGATTVTREARSESHVTRVLAQFAAGQPRQAIDITSLGTAMAFTGLLKHDCDIGLASRQATQEEARELGEGGEHVIALDGISVIANSKNPVHAITREDLKGIFSGSIGDWSAVGGTPGPFKRYIRNGQSGTADAFRHFMGIDAMTNDARVFDENVALSDAVALEPQSIGFVGMAYVRDAKALGVSTQGTTTRYPSPFTVSTETYPLSRRLYLYTGAHPIAFSNDFIRFAVSPAGQKAVRTAGFVDLGITLQPFQACDSSCPSHYTAITKTARRLSFDFRFHEQGAELDTRGVQDLERLLAFLRENPGGRLALLGFSDPGLGSAAAQADSLACAKAVATMLQTRGVGVATVKGFGGAMPVAVGSPEARVRNRRVEVWLREEK